MPSPILAPLIALVLWSFVMWAWLYVTRIPAMRKNKIIYDPHRPNNEFVAQIPAQARWKADNYNNLMEQPTLFYALVFYTDLAHRWPADIPLILAWIYVALRVVHSLVQATVNVILVRFAIYATATLVLAVMAGRDVLALL